MRLYSLRLVSDLMPTAHHGRDHHDISWLPLISLTATYHLSLHDLHPLRQPRMAVASLTLNFTLMAAIDKDGLTQGNESEWDVFAPVYLPPVDQSSKLSKVFLDMCQDPAKGQHIRHGGLLPCLLI